MEQMKFPKRFEEFIRRNSFNAKYVEVCGDGSPVISISDVKQGIEHYFLDNKWISVEDRLPEEHVEVILYNRDRKCVESGWLDDKENIHFSLYDDDFEEHDITHWMSLPEPPKDYVSGKEKISNVDYKFMYRNAEETIAKLEKEIKYMKELFQEENEKKEKILIQQRMEIGKLDARIGGMQYVIRKVFGNEEESN